MDRGITKIDYLVISHFDSDHSANAREVLENLKVKNIIISKQVKISNEFTEIMEIVKKRKVNIIIVQAGDVINIDKYTYLKILWPDNNNIVDKNDLNNNSIVFKLCYKDFSIIFTGDIEKSAEEEITKIYNKEELHSTILKIAHHGSATSTKEDFLKRVTPKIALIGVGKNNNFGHPSEETINLLKAYGINIYRTDIDGEISIIIDNKGKMKIKTYV